MLWRDFLCFVVGDDFVAGGGEFCLLVDDTGFDIIAEARSDDDGCENNDRRNRECAPNAATDKFADNLADGPFFALVAEDPTGDAPNKVGNANDEAKVKESVAGAEELVV